MRSMDKTPMWFRVAFAVAVTVFVAFWASAAYVAVHFIGKFW